MPEIKVRNLVLIAIPLAVGGCLIAVCAGFFAIPAFELGGFKFGGLSKKELQSAIDQGAAITSGYKAAKNPQEAMDGFHRAIQARQYKFAAMYTTKAYGDQLIRAHDSASAIGDDIDRIKNFANEKGQMTDKLAFILFRFDPFPKNFKVGPAPVVTGNKATGAFIVEGIKLEKGNPVEIELEINRDLDARMFQNLLRQPLVLQPKLEILKEGEEWKLDIPSNPLFETNVGYYNDHAKSYITALNGFVTEMNRFRNVTKSEFEQEVMRILSQSK